VSSGGSPAPDRGLLLPLMLLLTLQLVALWHLPRPWPLASPTGGVGLPPLSAATVGVVRAWGSFNVLMLLLAIRSCWDRRGGDGTPWFALAVPVTLRHAGGEIRARLEAISRSGAEIRLEPAPAGSALPAPQGAGGGDLVLVGLLPDGRPLPFVPVANGPGTIGGLWGALSPLQREQLEGLLYQRERLWPTLRAPFEPRALPVVALRLLQRIPPESWFQRSLIPQLPPMAGLPIPSPAGPAATATGSGTTR